MDIVRFQKRNIADIKLDDFIKHFDSKDSFLRGNYIRTIDIWERYFPTERFHICFFDDIVNCPKIFLKNLLSFLEIDPKFIKCSNIITKPINRSVIRKIHPALQSYLVEKYFPLIQQLNKRFGKRISWINDL